MDQTYFLAVLNNDLIIFCFGIIGNVPAWELLTELEGEKNVFVKIVWNEISLGSLFLTWELATH